MVRLDRPDVQGLSSRLCENCDAPLVITNPRGAARRFCSVRCQARAWERSEKGILYRLAHHSVKIELQCRQCHSTFMGYELRNVYCSPKCGEKYHSEIYRARLRYMEPEDIDLAVHLIQVCKMTLFLRHPELVPKPRIYQFRQKTRTGYFERIVIDGIPYVVTDEDLKRVWEMDKPRAYFPKLPKNRPKFYADGKPANRAAWQEMIERKKVHVDQKKRLREAQERLKQQMKNS